jgi:microcystin-dependent protein
MKQNLTLLFSVLISFVFAQAPQLINYQGVARDQYGDPIANKTIKLRFDILQGTSSATVFTEQQSVATGSLGVFSTQIGKSIPAGLQAIDWKSGPYALQVSIDTANGQNFVTLGKQDILSVPFSMMSRNVPSSYTNNILSIGTDTYALSTFTSGTGITINSGSVISNSAPDQTVVLNNGINVNITGTYPDFTVSATPTLGLLGANTLSISGGNSVTIAPSLSINNNTLTVGPTGNTIALPSAPSTSLIGTGAANIATLGTNSYSINVPTTSVSQGTNVSVQGSFPNYTISAAGASLVGSGAANVATLGANSYSINVNPTAISNGTNVQVSGSYPNFTVNATPTLNLLGPNTLSISGGNTVQLAPSLAVNGNSLSVGPSTNAIAIPVPTVIGAGAATVTPSTGLNFLVTVPMTTLTASGNGISITSSGTNTFNLSVQAPTLTGGTNVNVTGTHPNFVINATPTLSLLGANSLSISGSPATVAIAPSLSFTNGVLTVGPTANTVTIPTATTNIVGSGALIVTPLGTNSYSLNVPLISIVGGSNVNVSGTYPNYLINSTPALSLNGSSLSISNGNTVVIDSYTVSGPGLSMSAGPVHTITATPSNPTITSTGIANVTPVSGTAFTVNVPAPALTSSGNTITVTQGTASSSASIPPPTLTTLGTNNSSLTAGGNTVSLNTYTVTGSGLSMAGGPNYTITSTIQTPSIVGSGAAAVNPTSGTSFTVNVPLTSVTATGGIASVSGVGTNSFDVNVPAATYAPATGILSQGPSAVNITPSVSVSGNVVTVGPAGNSFTLPASSSTFVSAGIATVSPATGNVFTVDVAVPNFTGQGVTSVTGSYPNYTISTPAPQATVTGSGAAVVSPTLGTNFNVNVPQTLVTATTGVATISSAGTNTFNVNVPSPVYVPATGALNTGTATTNITQALSYTNNVLTSGPSSNSITIPPVSITGTNAAFVTNTGTSFTVDVPLLNLTATGASSISGLYPNLVVNTPTPSIQGINASTVTGVYPNYTVNTPATNISGTGAATVTGIYPTYVVNVPTPTITGTGLASVTPSGSNFTVNVPVLTYTPSTGALGSGSNSVSILPQLTFASNVLTSGPTTNSVNLSAVSPWASSAGVTTLTTLTDRVGIGTSTPAENLQVQSTTNAQLSIVSSNTGVGGLSFGNSANHFLGNLTFDNSTTNLNFATNGFNRMTISGAGNVGIGTSNPTSKFVVDMTNANLSLQDNPPGTGGTANTVLMAQIFGRSSNAPQMRWQVLPNVNVMDIGLDPNGSFVIEGNDNPRMVVTNGGLVGIGNSTPTENLQVQSATTGQLSIVSGNTNAGGISFGNTANHFKGNILYDNSANSMSFWTNNVADRMVIAGGGNVGIGTNSPLGKLTVDVTNATFHLVDLPPGSGAIANTVLFGSIIGKSSNGPQVRYTMQSSANWIDVGLNANNDFVVEGNDNQRLVVQNTGNVGIGTSAPAEKLQVEDAASTQISVISGNAQSSSIAFGSSTNHNLGQVRYDNNTNSMNFWTQNTPNRLYIDNSGFVGIGHTNPSPHNLSVYSPASSCSIRLFNVTSASFGVLLEQNNLSANLLNYENTPFNFGTNGATRMTITSAGNVGIGNVAPTSKLDVSGTLRVNDGTQATGKVLTSNATGVASWQEVLPSGMIMAYGGNTIPTGWSLCDGSAVSRVTFANLFAAIGTAYGVGNGSTTFNLPDLRGMFLRGVSSASGNDPDVASRTAVNSGNAGNNVGSVQQDQLEVHSHSLNQNSTVIATLLGGVTVKVPGGGDNTNATGGNETRPKNVYVNYIIKQ